MGIALLALLASIAFSPIFFTSGTVKNDNKPPDNPSLDNCKSLMMEDCNPRNNSESKNKDKDFAAIPEPLTILGAVSAIGLGLFFRARKK